MHAMESAIPAEEPRRRITRAEFDRMVAAGVFDDEHTELLYGELFTMTINPKHASLSRVLTKLLVLALGDRAQVGAATPLAASDLSEPEPDLAVFPNGNYDDEHPSTALWLIEISDSTLRKDREIKAPLYAETGVPEYWVVDVQGRAIEVYSEPVSGRYQRIVTYGAGQVVSPAAFPDVKIAVDRLFPSGPKP
jgi:Uma2 family endonuclease